MRTLSLSKIAWHAWFGLVLWASATTPRCLASTGGPSAADAPRRPRAPFKVLLSNDTTNITSCVSPYRRTNAIAAAETDLSL